MRLTLRRSRGARNSPGTFCGVRPSLADPALRSLAEIEERSQALLEKKKAVGFLDKGKDSQEVAGLVEQLRTAIVYYRVSGGPTARTYTTTDAWGTALTATINV